MINIMLYLKGESLFHWRALIQKLRLAIIRLMAVLVICTQLTEGLSMIFFFQTDERVKVNEHVSFVDHQTTMVRLAKQIARTAQDMVRH